MEDAFGDGWAGALPGRVDTWSITQALSASDLTDPVGDGSLPYGHYSGVNTLCLEDGFYTFTSTANSAWSDEASWDVCGVTGGTGGTLEFEVGGGTCKSVDDSAASGPPSTDLKSSSDEYCTLPEESQCVGLDVGVAELSGPSVGMYYDEACLEGGGGVSGCGGGDVTECRLCFVNRDLWKTDFPDLRTPDWNDCPCCVADALGVTCQGGFVETAASSSFLDKAEAFYTEGSVAMVATVSGLLALGVITAVCCCRGIHKDQQKALTYKHSRSAIYEDFNDGGTSPDVSPPLRRSSSAGPTKPGGPRRKPEPVTALPATAARLSAAEAGKSATRKQQPAQKYHQPRGGKGPRRDGGPAPPAPAATVGGRGATTALDGHHQHQPRRSALPPVEAHNALRLPGAARDNPPSDASWPTDPRVGISVSGKKNPRWSGGRELKAYLRRTGYDRVEGETVPGEAPRLEGAGGNRMLQAMKSASSRLSEKSKQTFDWVEDPQGLEMGEVPNLDDGGRISMMDIMAALDLDEVPVPVRKTRAAAPPAVALGDLPVQPPPPPGFTAPIPARITAVPKDKNGRSKSKSRARSRGGNAAPPEDEDRRMPSWSSRGGSGRARSRRVVPTEDADDGKEELHTLDKAFAEQNWNAPSVDAPPAPAPPSPSTVRENGANERRYSAGRVGERQGSSSMAMAAASTLAAEAAEAIRKQRQGRAREGAADRKADRGHRSKSEAQAQEGNRHRSTGEGHHHRSGHGHQHRSGQGQGNQHRSGQGQGHQHRGRESERRGRGGDAGDDANDANHALRSKSNPAGPDRETEGERRRRRARDAGHDSSQGPGQETRGRERRAQRSENRTGHGAGRSSSQGQAYSSGREKSVEAHQERHERRKSAGRKDIHKMLMDENRRVSQERTSKSPGPPQEQVQARPAREKRVSGGGRGGGGADSRPAARAHVPVPAVAVKPATKQSSSTRFSSDPRARKERAEKLRQRQANAAGRGEE